MSDKRRFLRACGVLALAAGCTGPLDGATTLRSSNTTLDANGDLLIADADNGTLVQVSLSGGDLVTFLLGQEPTRIARIGDIAFVTLRAAGEVAVVDMSKDEMVVKDRIAVGGEPYGVVAAPDGRHVYVALSTADAVVAIDTSTFEVSRSFHVPDQPRWLAMHPDGVSLYVACAMRGGVYRVDVRNGEVEPVWLPPIERGDPNTGEVFETTPRVTGDPAIDPEGGLLAVPTLYVDTTSSVGGPDPMSDDTDFENPERGGGGYASGVTFDGKGLTRFNPGVVVIPLGPDGTPRVSEAQATLVAGQVDRSETRRRRSTGVDTADGTLGTNVRGYLSSVAFTDDGHAVLATVEGGAAVAVIPAHPVTPGQPFEFEKDPFFGSGAFEVSPSVFVGTGAGPQGVAIDADGNAWVYGFLDRVVSKVDTIAAMGAIEDAVSSFDQFDTAMFVGSDIALEPSLLPDDVQAGRKLFYSSSLDTMAIAGAGVSCATCHFDGRDDGITWQFDHGVRQTPSLAGQVSATAPVTWTNDVASVADEVFLTSQGRMGGHGISSGQMLQVSTYIDFTRDVIPPTLDGAAVARGRAIFERADTACSTCHSGARYTDNRSHAMVGLNNVNTPGLRGIVATAPYFHDGSAATLRDVLEMADDVRMGHTDQLSAAELDDLETYLRSL